MIVLFWGPGRLLPPCNIHNTATSGNTTIQIHQQYPQHSHKWKHHNSNPPADPIFSGGARVAKAKEEKPRLFLASQCIKRCGRGSHCEGGRRHNPGVISEFGHHKGIGTPEACNMKRSDQQPGGLSQAGSHKPTCSSHKSTRHRRQQRNLFPPCLE